MMENQGASMSPVGLRQGAGTAKTPRRAADVQAVKALVQGDALGAHGLDQPPTLHAEAVAVELQAQLVVARPAVRQRIAKRLQAGNCREGVRQFGDSAGTLRVAG